MTGGLFSTPAQALAFVGAVAGVRLAHEASCRKGTSGIWVEVAAPSVMAAELARAAGGLPYVPHGSAWARLSVFGDVSDDSELLDVSGWTPLALGELVAGATLRHRQMTSAPLLEVVVPAGLGRWVLRRTAMLGLSTRVSPVLRHPLCGSGPASGALLVQLRAERGMIARSLLLALVNLPYTIVGIPTGTENTSLLVDVRCHVPMVEALLADMVPEGETWVLGAADIGHCRLERCGRAIDGATLLEAPELPVIDLPPVAPASLPRPIAVGLRPLPGPSERVDAVLLDDVELDRIKPFLAGRPPGEVAFLVPGAGKHLLTAPGGLPARLPLGIPLFRAGPGGLYIESGMGFFPPLPERARREIFGLDERHAVAVIDEGAYWFDMQQLIPAWALWVGESPKVRGGLSKKGVALLQAVSKTIRERGADQPEARPGKRETRTVTAGGEALLRQALRAEHAEDLVRAAELMEAAGQMLAAARLYERAAKER